MESLEKQHDLCPRNGWCCFDKKRLPHVFVEQLMPIFTRLSEDKLLDHCLQGLPQKENEAANQVLWGKCPTTKFCGRNKVLLAVTNCFTF